MTRAALYVRVSTKEQTAENQERELRQWADHLGFEVVKVYADTASGAKSDRAALTGLLAGAHRREFDVLLIWALDRLSREGIAPTLGYLNQLTAAGVRVMSYREAWADSSTPMWELFVSISAFWAKLEHQRIGERVRAGQARAKVRGTKSGRPFGRPLRLVDLEDLRRRRSRGESWRRISRALKAPVRTLRRAWQKSQAEFAPEQVGLAMGSHGPEGRGTG